MIKRLLGVSMKTCVGMIGMWDRNLVESLPKGGQPRPIGWNKIWKNKEADADASSALLEWVLDCCFDHLRISDSHFFTLPKQTLPVILQVVSTGLGLTRG